MCYSYDRFAGPRVFQGVPTARISQMTPERLNAKLEHGLHISHLKSELAAKQPPEKSPAGGGDVFEAIARIERERYMRFILGKREEN